MPSQGSFKILQPLVLDLHRGGPGTPTVGCQGLEVGGRIFLFIPIIGQIVWSNLSSFDNHIVP